MARELDPVHGQQRPLEPLAEVLSRSTVRHAPRRSGRTPPTARPPRPHSPSLRGDAAPGCRRAAGRGGACPCAPTARRRPSVPRTCGRRARRRSAPSASTSSRRTAPPGRHRHGAARPCASRTRCAIVGDRLERADLVVGEHDRDQDRPVGEGRFDVVGVDPAVAVDRQLDDLEAELLEVAERVPDGVVLDGAGHDPVAARLARPRGALEREVVGLRAARREDDLARLRADRAPRAARAPRRGRRGPCGRTRAPTTGCRSAPSGTAASRRATSRRSGVVAAWSR